MAHAGIQDPQINRLEDTLHLWTLVVSNKLLENVNIILFLNKVGFYPLVTVTLLNSYYGPQCDLLRVGSG
jgi:hypothetical protein